jgi:hypothetical protein
VCDYAHLNPVRAGLIPPEAALQAYRWSSYPAYLQEPARRPAWLRVDRLFGEWGIPLDSPAGREQFAGQMEARRRAEGTGEFEPKGWCLGSEEFRQELLAQVSRLASSRHAGEEIRLVCSWARPRTWLPCYSIKRREPKIIEKLRSDPATVSRKGRAVEGPSLSRPPPAT